MPYRPLRLSLTLAALLLPAVPSAEVVPLTAPVTVGLPPNEDYALYSPEVAALPGEFVVAWGAGFVHYSGSQPLNRGSAIIGRKVGADGVPSGGEIPLVPVTRFSTKGAPRVAANAAGAFVVTWAEANEDLLNITQNLLRFPPGGTVGPRLVLDHFPGRRIGDDESAVALDAAGRAFAVWTHPRTAAPGLLGQIFRPGGRPLSARFWATLRAAPQGHPDLAAFGRGQAVLAFQKFGPGGTAAVVLRLYDQAGQPQGVDVQVSPPSPAVGQSHPALAVNRDGSLVVAWEEGQQVWARRFAPPLRPVGPPIQIDEASQPASQPADFPDVAIDPQGRFVVTWFESDSERHHPQIRGRGYAADGTPLGDIFRVDREGGVDEEFYGFSRPSVAASDAGTFLITWVDTDQTAFNPGILARLFAVGPPGG